MTIEYFPKCPILGCKFEFVDDNSKILTLAIKLHCKTIHKINIEIDKLNPYSLR